MAQEECDMVLICEQHGPEEGLIQVSDVAVMGQWLCT